MPDLAGYGEDRLVAALLDRLPETVRYGAGIVAGAGDDCAVVDVRGEVGRLQLLKTDCVIEGVHYTADTPPEKVGWKAVCRPLSDIAAMGGWPLHALVTLALPGTASLEYAKGIYDGIGLAAERFGVRIVGGETARSPSVGFVSVVLSGSVEAEKVVTRAGGRVGDRIYVTGRLGGSLASGRHLGFVPRLKEARWLVEHFRVSAMMDLSDGLGQDLVRLATTSKTGYAVDRSKLPRHPDCSIEQAISDGEDYELLFTIHHKEADALETRWHVAWPHVDLSQIGELVEAGSYTGLKAGAGFDHFAVMP